MEARVRRPRMMGEVKAAHGEGGGTGAFLTKEITR